MASKLSDGLADVKCNGARPDPSILALTRTASVNGPDSVNGHDDSAKGRVQDADKDDDDSEDEKDDTGHVGGDGANGGKVTPCKKSSSFRSSTS